MPPVELLETAVKLQSHILLMLLRELPKYLEKLRLDER